jgi:hypothetical protein
MAVTATRKTMPRVGEEAFRSYAPSAASAPKKKAAAMKAPVNWLIERRGRGFWLEQSSRS